MATGRQTGGSSENFPGKSYTQKSGDPVPRPLQCSRVAILGENPNHFNVFRVRDANLVLVRKHPGHSIGKVILALPVVYHVAPVLHDIGVLPRHARVKQHIQRDASGAVAEIVLRLFQVARGIHAVAHVSPGAHLDAFNSKALAADGLGPLDRGRVVHALDAFEHLPHFVVGVLCWRWRRS